MGFGRPSGCSRSRSPSPPQKRTTFIRSVELLDGRDRDYEPGAASPKRRELRPDLGAKVPGQDHDDVRAGVVERLWWSDRDVHPGCEAAVLVGVAVNREREEVGPDPAVVEEGVRLARGTVGGDRPASRTC